MNLYEMTKKYGSGKGESMMWTTLEHVSKAIEESMAKDARDKLMKSIYGELSGGHYNADFAREDVGCMYYIDSADEEHYAPYWTDNQVEAAYESVKAKIPAYNMWDFYVTMHMLYSDNYNLLKDWFPTEEKDAMTTRIVQMSVAWLNDVDSKHPDNKIWWYLNK